MGERRQIILFFWSLLERADASALFIAEIPIESELGEQAKGTGSPVSPYHIVGEVDVAHLSFDQILFILSILCGAAFFYVRYRLRVGITPSKIHQ